MTPVRAVGRRGSRARQIDLADLAAHTAGEVAVRRGNAHIARGDKTLVRAEAGTAAGVENGGAGVADDLRPAALFHLAEDLAGGGNDEHVDVGADLLAFKCLGDLLMSFRRPLVQLPTTTCVTLMPAFSRTGTTFAGLKGQEICGSSVERSIS